MSSTIDAIRERWVGRAWLYGESHEGGRAVNAFIVDLDAGGHLIEVLDPADGDRAFLIQAAAAPGDVQALLAEIDAAGQRLRALQTIGDADGPITRQMIMATLLMPRNTADLDAYIEAVHALLRTTLQGAAARAEQAEADSAAWWQIVGDLYQLGCLDCSNNACDRARDALGAGHPGAELLKRLEAAEATANYVISRLAAVDAERLAQVERAERAEQDYAIVRDAIIASIDPPDDDAAECAILAEAVERAATVLRAFVEDYTRAVAKADLLEVWLRACGVLGITPTTTPEDAARQATNAARIAARLGELFQEGGD